MKSEAIRQLKKNLKIILKKEGWKYLNNSKFWHYFREGTSLCGKWATFSMEGCEQGNNDSPDNCKKCKEKLLQEVRFPPKAMNTNE